MQDMIARHDNIILQFSGGKDSLACLHLCRKWLDKITVAWVNTGDAFPESIQLMEKVREAVPHFVEIPSGQPLFVNRNGWPVDILPVRNTEYGNRVEAGHAQPMVGYPVCCNANIWQPMDWFVVQSGATLVIRGTKAADGKKSNLVHGQVIDGVQYAMPLWDMTDLDVLAIVKAGEFGVPDHYAYVNSSLDCMHCTAYLSENAGKLKFMRAHHPELAAEMVARLGIIRAAVKAELAYIEGAV